MIVHFTSEVTPFYKRGGLGDVSGALPKYLAAKHRNTVISFFYEGMMKAEEFARRKDVVINIQSVDYTFVVYHKRKDDVDFYFLNMSDKHLLADMESDGNDIEGEDGDKPYKGSLPLVIYLYFAKAALQLVKDLDLRPEILICHDWHVCGCFAFPSVIAELNPEAVCSTILLIHNYEHQGEVFSDAFYLLEDEIHNQFLPLFREYGNATLLALGVKNADYVATVSAGYAEELMEKRTTHPGLKYLRSIKRKKIYALPNGIDTTLWSPETSPFIEHQYNSSNAAVQKKKAKVILQEMFNFSAPDKPVVLMMARLTEQKGISIIANLWEDEALAVRHIKEVLDTGIHLIICGRPSGGLKGPIHKHFAAAQKHFPGSFTYIPDYSDALAHKLLAGADAILCPSLFEPCGLVQIYGMAFGTVPVVRPVGGLRDTVIPYCEQEESSTGFYIKEFSHTSLIETLETVVKTFTTRQHTWRQIAMRGMSQDYSWEQATEQYDTMFRNIKKEIAECRLLIAS
jgi:starch synthase